jgi:AcrR family transcriptional regulator
MPTQAARAERSTEALLDAAAELIAEGGLGSMTFAAIGDRAGYSRGLVTARFGSKAGLVDALIRRVFERLREAQSVPLGDGECGLDDLVALVAAIRDLTLTNAPDMRALLALMFEALGTDAELRARMARFHQVMRVDIAAALERGVSDGSVRPDVDPVLGALVVVSLLRGLAYQWLLEPERLDLVAAYDATIGLIRDHFGVASAARARPPR